MHQDKNTEMRVSVRVERRTEGKQEGRGQLSVAG